MQWVEGFGFPTVPRDFHARRTRWLFNRSIRRPLRRIPVVVVAGSCGKASTARFLAFILQALFKRCGMNCELGLGTKPPLVETTDGNRERWQFLSSGAPRSRWVDEAEFTAWVDELRPLVASLENERPDLGPPASYDLRAWILGRAFLAHSVRLGIVEANIGLRHDPASVFESACLFGLTPIGTDHATLLRSPARVTWLEGESAGPLWHKAGGVRRGVPVVLGSQASPNRELALKLLRTRGAAPVLTYGEQYGATDVRVGFNGVDFRLRVRNETLNAHVDAVGHFHAMNAAQAAMMAWVLQEQGTVPGERKQLQDAIVEGLSRADSPGRADIVEHHPCVIRAVAMSHTKVLALRDTVRELQRVHGPVPLTVCASFLDRVFRVQDCVAELAALPDLKAWFSITPPSNENAVYLSAQQMNEWVTGVSPHVNCQSFARPAQAVDAARASATRGGIVLLVGDGGWFNEVRAAETH